MTENIDPGWVNDREKGKMPNYGMTKENKDMQEAIEDDRENGKSELKKNQIGQYSFDNPSDLIQFKNDKNGYTYPVKKWIAMARDWIKTKDLELENKELRKAWETLLEHNEQEDVLSDKLEKDIATYSCQNELLKKLLKSLL